MKFIGSETSQPKCIVSLLKVTSTKISQIYLIYIILCHPIILFINKIKLWTVDIGQNYIVKLYLFHKLPVYTVNIWSRSNNLYQINLLKLFSYLKVLKNFNYNVRGSHFLLNSNWQFRLFVSDNGTSNKLFHDFIATTIDGLNSGVNKCSSYGIFPHVSPSTMQLETASCDGIL